MHRFRYASIKLAKTLETDSEDDEPTRTHLSTTTLVTYTTAYSKRSDPKRGQVPTLVNESQAVEQLPPLPPASDFRTSLILPDLTRRFSVLRNSSGEPIGVDELKSRFEAQRARGSQNRLSESEEDMILEALSRLRSTSGRQKAGIGRGADPAASNLASTYSDDTEDLSRNSISPSLSGGQSVRSTGTVSSALHGSPSVASFSSAKGSQMSRRMSNNLFGSGKFHDQSYLRNTQRVRPITSRSSSVKHSDSATSMSTLTSRGNNNSMYSDSLRPMTPEGSAYTNSVPSSPNNTFSTRDDDTDRMADLGAGLAKALSPEVLGRASLALDEVIKEIEEEGDDEIVMERSPISVTPNNSSQSPTTELSASPALRPTLTEETGMALSSDEQIISDEPQRSSPYPRSRTTSPIPRLPGYIPGMPRPMTPREVSVDADDHTPSATPRATSPRLPGISSPPPIGQSIASSMYRTHSSTSISRNSRPTSPASPTPVSPSPLFFNRTPSGRYTPEDRSRTSGSSPTPDPVDSPVLGRRRPLSPLSSTTFQPMVPVTSSRPTTPSNIIWNPSSSPVGSKAYERNGSISALGHSRNSSTVSMTDNSGDLDLLRSSARSGLVRTPTYEDSIWHDVGRGSTTSLAVHSDARPTSALSGMDLGSTAHVSNRSVRSPTPTHNTSHSPTSPVFSEFSSYTNGNMANGSRRSSRQNAHSSFALSSSQALLLSPIGNSSRSSLGSAGSSYHSWDEDHKKDRLFDLFNHLDLQQNEWHDLTPDQSSSSTSRTTPYDNQESEELVCRKMGLNKSDIAAMQDKLVTAALTKAATPEGRNRAGSIRKRRPSTSQSNYSYNGGESRVATPAQQAQTVGASAPTPTPRIPNSGQIALLDAVVDSIQSPRKVAIPVPALVLGGAEETTKSEAPVAALESKISSPNLRHRALADMLFGSEDHNLTKASVDAPLVGPADFQNGRDHVVSGISGPTVPTEPDEETHRGDLTVPLVEPVVARTVPVAPLEQHDPTMLALDVQRRAEAATAALRKSPSIPKVAEPGSIRRKISPNQISSPTLLSASTSVDAIPLPATHSNVQQSVTNPPATKLGSRFKKLRGTLRAKTHTSSGEDVSLYPASIKTPPPSQTVTYNLTTPGASQTIASATELLHTKISPSFVPTPPASATPGLRGFMSLFRKQRHGQPPDVSPFERRGTPVPPSMVTASNIASQERRIPPPLPPVAQSAPAEQSQFATLRPLSPQSPLSSAFTSSETIPEDAVVSPQSAPAAQNGEAALKQLFDAAQNLGLDRAALNDLVARSPSMSSKATTIRTRGTRSNSVTDSRQSTLQDPRESALSQSSLLSERRPSVDVISPRPSTEVRQLTIRRNSEATSTLPQTAKTQQAAADPLKAIVRRTIIVPSDSKTPSAIDFNAFMRKQSLSRRRRSAGAASNSSNKSLQDRAPTPPPPKSAGGKRFSTDRSPPVPQLPLSFSLQQDNVSPGQVEQSNSAYDSLYEMYTTDSRAINGASPDGFGASSSQRVGEEESGPAVEVIELANGETIWSIVNGLRDDDAESFYDSRKSFASDYSGEGVKVLFKEHTRKGSRGSNISFLSKKKHLQAPSASPRPETKVFFSSSAQIGRLIENLSRDMDAGSFNITPDHTRSHAGHSASSSMGSAADMRWTVEERLEHMLGSMSANS